MYRFNHKLLEELMLVTLKDKGIKNDIATNVVQSLVQTSLRGVDSHGINLFPHYCQEIDAGRINKSPNIQTTHLSPCSKLVDADHTFGHHAGIVAVDIGCESAQEYGMSGVAVKNSSHFGAAAYFGLHAARKDFICMAFTNADALVKGYGSRESFFGTNPICFCAPMLNEDPFCLDMATSQISWNKIKEYSRNRLQIPDNLAYDSDGNMTTDPDQVKMLAPIGEYKGFDLGMVVDILCALLGGGLISKDILPMYKEPLSEKRYICHYFVIIKISDYVDVEEFKNRLKSMSDRIRNLSTANGIKQVMIAGDPEKIKYIERNKKGIPVFSDVFQNFLLLSPEFNEALKIGKENL
jgi:ureidoglycolate dehydrogenase (NAD+)